MVGFGPEDNHFVVELTYNYGIKEYKLGNDFQVKLAFEYFILKDILKTFYLLPILFYQLNVTMLQNMIK